jgi:hypothetical protein
MKKLLSLLSSAIVLISCAKDELPLPVAGDEFPLVDSLWTINVLELKDGNIGKDGIEAIHEPVHVSAQSADFLDDSSLVIGIAYKGLARAYPISMLNYHEIVNDQINDMAFSVTYSVISGTAVTFKRSMEDSSGFGVSGLLYRSNLIMYDLKTKSAWSQMLQKAVSGEKVDENLEVYPSFQTTWKTWKSWYPETTVMGPSAEILPDYKVYPYGNYRQNNDSLFFGLTSPLNAIPNKERVLGIKTENGGGIARKALFGQLNAYSIQELGGEELLIFGSGKDDYLMAYYPETTNGEPVTIKESLLGKEPGGLFADTQGTKWDINGLAYSGLRKGQQLKIPVNYVGYAFCWAVFYPEFFGSER